MVDIGIGIGSMFVGFIVAMYVMRWAISDLRENARRAIRLRNQAEEVVDNVTGVLRAMKKENAHLHAENQRLAKECERRSRHNATH